MTKTRARLLVIGLVAASFACGCWAGSTIYDRWLRAKIGQYECLAMSFSDHEPIFFIADRDMCKDFDNRPSA